MQQSLIPAVIVFTHQSGLYLQPFLVVFRLGDDLIVDVEDDPEAEDLKVQQRVCQTVSGGGLYDVLYKLPAVCPEL